MRLRLWLPVALGLASALAGPRLTLPHDKPAGTPFTYEPPEGFVEVNDAAMKEKNPGAKAWMLGDIKGQSFVPRVNTSHSPSRGGVNEHELKTIASQLPETFAPEIQWVEKRHETRVRPDGARVGIVEGSCTKMTKNLVGNDLEQKFRMLQLVFPEDTGTTIATATYAADEATKWEPIFEGTIARARGVATRVPDVPGWIFAAWGVGGVVMGWLAAALLDKAPAEKEETKPEPKKAPKPTANGNGTNGHARHDDDDDADDDDDDDGDDGDEKDPKKRDPKADA